MFLSALYLAGLLVMVPPDKPTATFRTAWRAPCEFLEGTKVFIAANNRHVFCDAYTHIVVQDFRSGKRKRKIPRGDCGGPVVDLQVGKDRLLVLCEYGRGEERAFPPVEPTRELSSYSLQTRKPFWRITGQVEPPAVHGDQVIVAHDNNLVLVDQKGHERWRVPKIDTSGVGPVISGEHVFAPTTGALCALRLDSGKLVWKKPFARPEVPLVAGAQNLFAAAVIDIDKNTSRITAVSKKDGTQVWQKTLTGEATYHPMIYDSGHATVPKSGTLYLTTMGAGDQPGNLYALNEETGKQVFRVALSTDANGHDFTPTIMQDQVLVWSGVSLSYALHSFDKKTGRSLWFYAPPTAEKQLFSRPLVRAGRILYGDGSMLRAIKLKKSRKRRK